MSQPWSALPQVLAADVAGRWPGIFADGVPSWLTESGAITAELLAAAIASSPFLAQTLERQPDAVGELLASRCLSKPTTVVYLQQRWLEYLAHISDEPGLHQALRCFRRETQFRIIWRDLLRQADLAETMAATSGFADVCIDGALHWLHSSACQQFGTPWGLSPTSGEDAPQKNGGVGHGQTGRA